MTRPTSTYWRYDRSREAPAWVWLFVISYTAGVIGFLGAVLW